MSVTTAEPIDLDAVTRALPTGGTLMCSGDPSQPGAVLSSEVYTDEQIQAAVTAPAAPLPQDEALAIVQALAASVPAQIAQAQADAATVATIVAGEPLAADHVAAIQRNSAAWPQLLAGLQALAMAAGVVS